MYFPKLRTPKNMIQKIYKKFDFLGPFDKQHLRMTKRFWNLNHTTLTIIIDHCERNWNGKISLSDIQSLKNVC